jgi:hypothetical protein
MAHGSDYLIQHGFLFFGDAIYPSKEIRSARFVVEGSRYLALVDVGEDDPLVIHECDDEQGAREAVAEFIAALRRHGRLFAPK